MSENEEKKNVVKKNTANKKPNNKKKTNNNSKKVNQQVKKAKVTEKAEEKEETVAEKVKETGKKISSEINKDDIKNETVETYNQVRDTLKNVDIKKDAEEAKGFIKEVFTDPFAAIRDAASEKKNVFSKAVIIVILWIAIGFIAQFISNIHYSFTFSELVRSLLNPLWYVLVVSCIMYLANKGEKKSLTTVMSTVVTASLPRVFISLVSLVDSIIDKLEIVTNPIKWTLSVATIVLMYYAAKELFGVKEDKGFFRKFILVVLVIEFVFKLLSLIGIGSIML